MDQSHGNIYNGESIRETRTKREISLDLVRGFAVVSMILTHAVAFFYKGSDPLISNLGVIGGVISFIIFLFISGAATYFSFIRYDGYADRENIRRRRRQIVYRAVGLLIGYYVVTTVASIPAYSFPPNITWLENLSRTLFLQNIPEFAEFILSFVLFALLAIPLRPIFKFLLRFPPMAIAIGLGFYVAGQLLAPIQLSGAIAEFKSLFVGNGEWHRFPIFQYLIVYILGLIWGKFLLGHSSHKQRTRISFLLLVVFSFLSVAGTIAFNYLGFDWLEPLQRWTPSVTFIALGLVGTYATIFVINFTGNLRPIGWLQVSLHYFGINSLNFFIFHTVALYVYKFASNDFRTDSTILFFVYWLILLLVTFILSSVKEWIVTNLKEEAGVAEGFGWLMSERVMVTGIWILIIFLAGLGFYQGRQSTDSIHPDQVLFKKRLIREQEWPFWWDHNYNFFKQLTVNATAGNPLYRNTWIGATFDHGAAVANKQSLGSGADVRVVYYSDEGFIELPFIFEGIGGGATLKFKVQDDIYPDVPSDRYFVYYGNVTDTAYPASKETPPALANSDIKSSEIFSHKLAGNTNRKWLLKEGGGVTLQQRTLLYTVQLDPSLDPESLVSYSIEGSNLRGLMDSQGGGKYQASVKVSELNPGIYKIQAVAREKDNKLKLIESGYSTFYVTHPLYVAWTQDWEGFDNQYLNEWLLDIDAFARNYGLVMTHFYNPRIFATTAISKARADQQTLWVLNRAKNYGDEIGLHLHMWYDLVRAAGVTPKSTDYAPWLYGDGGGVAAYTYTVEEMKKILLYSRRVFQDNGLPSPISFRAGGWLAKENTLQALEETGFLIDSSGRTAAGNDPFTSRMAALRPPWNLSPTQRPYRPNKTDINSSAAPTFNIWEFPNNGADSIWYNEVEMIKRFDLNYPNKGQILVEPQVLTYLSHPPFWSIDKPRVTKLFEYIKQFNYKDDRGPVVYTTLENAYTYWDRN